MSTSDQIPEVTNERGFLDAALWYAGHGFRVHPLHQRSKQPVLTEWRSRASSDPETVKGWWTEYPFANIGAPTGLTNRFLVIDIDVKNDPERVSGYRSMIELEKHFPGIDCSSAVRAVTPSGGMHLFFAITVPFATRLPWLPDVDLLGEKRQVLLPPSVRNDSGYNRSYRFLDDRTLADLQPLPESLSRALSETRARSAHSKSPSGRSRGSIDVANARKLGLRVGERDTGFQSLSWTLVLRHYPHFDLVRQIAYEVWEKTDQPFADPYPWQEVEDKLNRAWDTLAPRLRAEYDWVQQLGGHHG